MIALGAALSMVGTAFYSTAATAIPVLMVAYIVEVAALLQRGSRELDELAATIDRGAGELADAVRPEIDAAQAADPNLKKVLDTFAGAFEDTLDSYARRLRMAVLLPTVLLTGIPIAGEVCALLALSGNHANHAIFLITWLGLGIALLMIFVPMLQALALVLRPGFRFRRRPRA